MKRKISFEFIGIVLTAILVFIIGATLIARNSLNRSTELNLNQYLEIIKIDADETDTYDDLINDYDGVSNHLRITIIDSFGEVLADSEAKDFDNHLNRPEIQSLGEVFIRHSDTLDIQMMYLASRLSNGNYLRVAIPTASTASFLNDFIGLAVVIGIIITLLSILIGQILIKRSLKPLIDIRNHLVEVGEGEYREIMPVEKYDEVNDLIKEINKINRIISSQIASLKLEKNKTDFLINHMKQGICVLDEKNQIIFLNRYLKDIYRFNIDININKDYRFLFREEDIQSAIDFAYKTRSNKDIIVEKEQRYYAISIDYSTKNWRNKPTVIIIYTDITSIKHVEDLKKDFFVNASHELKSPLTSIMGSSELIKEGLVKDKATMIDLSNRIYQESHRMSDLVMDMLKLSEIESQKTIQSKEWIHITHTIDDIINNLNHLIKTKEMIIHQDISIEYIEFNPDDFYHMIKNILENAIKYSPKKSQVWIRIYKVENRLKIEIKDEGIGIPKEDQERIFERFYRVDKARSRISGGTGLGLSIVKHIVLNAGGHIFVESEENVGTTIHIELKEMTQSLR